MFNIFGRSKSKSAIKPPRAPGNTIREQDLLELRQWCAGRAFLEAYIEPETLVNELSAVVVDENGEFIRRRIGGPKGIDVIARELGCPVFDVEETGYPQRMRDRIERDRVLRKRQEQAERRRQRQQDEDSE